MTTSGAADFGTWFKRKFGASLPSVLPQELVHKDDEFWVSQSLVGKIEEPPMVPEFRADPSEYALAGFWGRGVNSNALYLVDVRGPHRRFFRLMCGGAYTKWEDDAKEIADYLHGYEAFRAAWEPKLAASTIEHNMGENTAELTLQGKPPIKVDLVMVPPTEWWAAVDKALTQANG